MNLPVEDDGQLHTLGLRERLRAQARAAEGAYSDLYDRVDSLLRELANPNPHDIANMSYRVELWERHADRIRWTVAASGSIVLARAAFEAAVTEWPHERFTLRQHMLQRWPVSKRVNSSRAPDDDPTLIAPISLS